MNKLKKHNFKCIFTVVFFFFVIQKRKFATGNILTCVISFLCCSFIFFSWFTELISLVVISYHIMILRQLIPYGMMYDSKYLKTKDNKQ